ASAVFSGARGFLLLQRTSPGRKRLLVLRKRNTRSNHAFGRATCFDCANGLSGISASCEFCVWVGAGGDAPKLVAVRSDYGGVRSWNLFRHGGSAYSARQPYVRVSNFRERQRHAYLFGLVCGRSDYLGGAAT